MRDSLRKVIVLVSSLTVAASIWAAPAEARRSSCAFCLGYCPFGELIDIECWQKCREPSFSVTCQDPYGVCGPSEVFVHCNGEID
jgi:hypothetical protein